MMVGDNMFNGFSKWAEKKHAINESVVNVGMQELMTTAKSVLGQQEYNDFMTIINKISQAINTNRTQANQGQNQAPPAAPGPGQFQQPAANPAPPGAPGLAA